MSDGHSNTYFPGNNRTEHADLTPDLYIIYICWYQEIYNVQYISRCFLRTGIAFSDNTLLVLKVLETKYLRNLRKAT